MHTTLMGNRAAYNNNNLSIKVEHISSWFCNHNISAIALSFKSKQYIPEDSEYIMRARFRRSNFALSFFTIARIIIALVACPFGSSFAPPPPCHDVTSKLHQRHSSMVLQISPIEVVVGLGAGFAGWLYLDGADDRGRRTIREEENARYEEYQAERSKKAHVEPKEFWIEAELAAYDGTEDEDGPILFAADGLIFNVWKGRNFYGPGGEYHIFAGRDATRLLARTKVEEETEGEANKPLTIGERAALAGWILIFKGKYEIVGKLKSFVPSTTSM
jgi:membrane-associated progesterone receptor component